MVKTSRQDWSQGQTVKIGFLSLVVLAVVPTPGDGRPDAYVLARGEQCYKFVPHFGIERITRQEAEDLWSQRGAGSVRPRRPQRKPRSSGCWTRLHFKRG